MLRVQVPRPLRVFLINLEDNRAAMNKRIAGVMKHYDLKPEDIGNRFFMKAKGEMKLKIAKRGRYGVERNEAAIEELIKYIIDNKIDVVSIDPLIKTHAVNENDNNDISAVVECYDDIAEAANCAIHLWHHTRKSRGEGVSVELARGAQAFIDACRSIRILETMTQAEGTKLKIENLRAYFRSFNGKINFAPATDQSDWHKLISVKVGNVGDGEPNFFTNLINAAGDEVGVPERWQHPGGKSIEITPTVIKAIKQAVGTERIWKWDVRAEMFVGEAIAPILGLDPEGAEIRGAIRQLIRDQVLKKEHGWDKAMSKMKMFVVAVPELAEIKGKKAGKNKGKK